MYTVGGRDAIFLEGIGEIVVFQDNVGEFLLWHDSYLELLESLGQFLVIVDVLLEDAFYFKPLLFLTLQEIFFSF